MTKAKAYYQAHLVIQSLSKEEYSLIPKDLLKEIESKMEIDKSIVVDKTVPLEKQKIDEKTYDILDKVIRAIEKEYGKDAIDNPEKYAEQANDNSRDDIVEIDIDDIFEDKKEPIDSKIKENNKKEKKSSSNEDLREENIRLKEIIAALEEKAKKLEEAKDLYYDYKEIVDKKDEIIKGLQTENEKLKQNNEQLMELLDHIPSIFRKLFKVDKLLK